MKWSFTALLIGTGVVIRDFSFYADNDTCGEHAREPTGCPADEAQAEFDKAFDWYNAERAGLGVNQ